MSFESKVLLGLADPEDANVEKDKERKRKRALLLQAEGTRKSGASLLPSPLAQPCPYRADARALFFASAAATSRPLASARRGAKPANNFAQSSFRG